MLPYTVALFSEHFLCLLLPVPCLTVRWWHPDRICNNGKRAGRKKSYIHFLVKLFFSKCWIRRGVKEHLGVSQRSEWGKERDPYIGIVEEVVRGKLGPLRSHCPKVWSAVWDNYRSDITWVVLSRASCMTSEMGILVHGVSRHSVNVHGTSYCDFTLCIIWVTNSLHSWLLLLSSLCREMYKPRAQYIMQTFSSRMKYWLQTALLCEY